MSNDGVMSTGGPQFVVISGLPEFVLLPRLAGPEFVLISRRRVGPVPASLDGCFARR